jgi:hypothetical protein
MPARKCTYALTAFIPYRDPGIQSKLDRVRCRIPDLNLFCFSYTLKRLCICERYNSYPEYSHASLRLHCIERQVLNSATYNVITLLYNKVFTS